MRGSGMRWGLPIGLAAAVLVIAAIIFNAASPDRTRMAANNNPSSQPAASKQAPESAIPPRGGATGPGAQPAPARSNPAGTQ